MNFDYFNLRSAAAANTYIQKVLVSIGANYAAWFLGITRKKYLLKIILSLAWTIK
jgi:hypothetical protein